MSALQHNDLKSGLDLAMGAIRPVWRDLEGLLVPKVFGAGTPVIATFKGQIRWYNYAAGDDMDCVFHMPHQWAPGTDLYLHLHWGHNGTDIADSSVIDYYLNYGKGHNQAPVGTEVHITQTIANLSIANTPQHQIRIDEFQISAAGGAGGLLNTDELEPDGLIFVHFDWTTIPTITGGSGKPFGFHLDHHLQIDRAGTLQRAPDFYSATP